jgi:uncharacterized protein (TIGR03437 family)
MRILNAILLATATTAIAVAAPNITGVFNAASGQPVIASAAFVSIFGSNLATTTDSWTSFSGGKLPTSLDGVQVTVNGLGAYVAFVSVGQINVIVPDDPTTGKVPVIVTNAQGVSNAFMIDKESVAPALFTFSAQGGAYAAAQSALNYQLVGPQGLFGQSVSTAAAVPYESIILWATGLGPTNPPQPTGSLVTAPVALASQIQLTIGGQTVTPQFVGLVYSGVYQINLVLPQLPSGNATIALTVNGVPATSALIPIQAPVTPIAGQTGPQLKNCVSGQVDRISYPISGLAAGQPNDVSIGGTELCPTCAVQTPPFVEFATKLELALTRNKGVKACYDANGMIYQVTVTR